MTSNTPAAAGDRTGRGRGWPAAAVCAGTGFLLFQFFGNANRGYIDTASLFHWWGFQWLNPASETEHGWLILGLSAWLLWRNLRIADLRFPIADGPSDQSPIANRPSAIPNWPSAIALLAALALHALGFVAQQARLSILALLLFTWGVLRLGGGRRWGAAAVFPLGFLVFAIPINVLDSVGFWLRVWVVDASAGIARLAGIGVLQSGTQLLAPDGAYNYDVAAACSGIRSLTALTALSLLAGYLNFAATWRRTLILLLCFPLVYVGNVARIVAIIFAAAAGGPKWGDLAHEVMGYGIFAIVLGGVLGAVAALRRWAPESASAKCHVISDTATAPPSGPPEECHVLSDTVASPRSGPQGECHLISDTAPAAPGPRDGECNVLGDTVASPPSGPREECHLLSDTIRGAGAGGGAVGIAAVVVVLAVGEAVFLRRVAAQPVRGGAGVGLAADGVNPVELPAFLGTEWIGRRAEVSAVEREILPPDTGYSRKQYVAVADGRQQVFLSIVLSGRDRSSIHRPELCLVGQGWTISDAGRHRLAGAAAAGGAGGGVEVTLLRVRREVPTPRGPAVVPQLVVYWFMSADRIVASHWQRLGWDAWNRVRHGRADRWAYVLMQTDALDGEEAALARLQAVWRETWPVFAARQP